MPRRRASSSWLASFAFGPCEAAAYCIFIESASLLVARFLSHPCTDAHHVCVCVQEFEEILLFESHIDRIFVLHDGISRLGQDDALPRQVVDAAADERSVRRFLASLGDDAALENLRGRVYFTPPGSRDEREVTKSSDGSPLETLAEKRAALEKKDKAGGVYLGELRCKAKYRHPQDGRFTKTLLSRGVCDWVGRTRAQAMPYWDRFDEGVFVGAQFGGSPMHVDQVTWSNVGKNFAGYKLVAIWAYGESSRALFDEHAYSLFVPPLSTAETEAISRAVQVALLGPGDLVVFSGGNAHMAMSISPQLSITAYESFINLNPTNLRAFLDSGTSAHYKQCRTRQPMLDDIKLEIAESANDLADDVERGSLRDRELEDAVRPWAHARSPRACTMGTGASSMLSFGPCVPFPNLGRAFPVAGALGPRGPPP